MNTKGAPRANLTLPQTSPVKNVSLSPQSSPIKSILVSQNSPVKNCAPNFQTSPVKSGVCFTQNSSPVKSTIAANTSSPGRKSPKRCQFADSIEEKESPDGGSRSDKSQTWVTSRRGAVESQSSVIHESPSRVTSSPGPSTTGSVGSSYEDATPPSKNCYRIIMLGSAHVGKSSLVARFLGNKFEDAYTPTIENFHRKLYRIRGEIYQLDILDTSGNHPFPAMRRLSILTGDLFVLVFSVDCRETFEEVIRIREQILETKASVIPGGRSNKKHQIRVPMVLAGNKSDKENRLVNLEEAETYCSTQDECCVYVEASAKRNYKVDEVFSELFLVANLPQEMAPNHHRRVNTAFGSPCTLPPTSSHSNSARKYTLSIKRRLSDACGVVAPNVRRPSIRTDLMIMRTKTCGTKADGDSNSGSPKMALGRFVRQNGQTEKKQCSLQ